MPLPAVLKKLPAPVRVIAEKAVPALKTAGCFVVGAMNAEVGGRILKKIPQVEAFAAQGPVQDGAVDLTGGLVLDGGIVAGVAAWKGAKLAGQVATPMIAGTIVKSAVEVGKPYVDRAVDSIFNLLGMGSERVPSMQQLPAGSPFFNLDIPGGGAGPYGGGGNANPYDSTPGGQLFGEEPEARQLAHGTSAW